MGVVDLERAVLYRAGLYVLPSLPPGNYQVTVTSAGFQTLVVADLRLDVATSVTKDLQLKVGSVSQQMEVTSEAPVIETSTTGVGQVINSKTVQEIPLNGRHFVDLNLLTPGTVTPPANGFLTAPLRGQGSFAINNAGQREDTTNWLVNGINLNDPVQNQVTFQPPIATLEEFKVDNSTFPAQYGRNAGAIVNMATRSGTNEFHGEAFEFFRNNALDARRLPYRVCRSMLMSERTSDCARSILVEQYSRVYPLRIQTSAGEH